MKRNVMSSSRPQKPEPLARHLLKPIILIIRFYECSNFLCCTVLNSSLRLCLRRTSRCSWMSHFVLDGGMTYAEWLILYMNKVLIQELWHSLP